MKIRHFVLTMLLASIALAADVSGTWTGVFRTNEGGEFQFVLSLKTDGNAVTGTMKQGGGDDIQIQNGKLDGDHVSFSITRSLQERTQKINFTGAVTGNEMKLSRQIEGGQRAIDITLTKK